MPLTYQSPGPTREETGATRGPLLLEFGTGWCGHCQLAAPAVEAAIIEFPHVPHIQVEDGKELARVVRPTTAEELRPALALLRQ